MYPFTSPTFSQPFVIIATSKLLTVWQCYRAECCSAVPGSTQDCHQSRIVGGPPLMRTLCWVALWYSLIALAALIWALSQDHASLKGGILHPASLFLPVVWVREVPVYQQKTQEQKITHRMLKSRNNGSTAIMVAQRMCPDSSSSSETEQCLRETEIWVSRMS